MLINNFYADVMMLWLKHDTAGLGGTNDLSSNSNFNNDNLLHFLFCKNYYSEKTIHKNKSDGNWQQTKKSIDY